ncbi:DNA gyrase subunit A, partial [Paenibacillus sp. 28ISP30-2]|nr:DNA gyrase subunit A [Paenibacillus sp. 28ISP30-2]
KEKNGPGGGLKVVKTEEDLMIITASGTLIRTSMEEISTMGRNTQGVRLINIREDDSVATVCRANKNEEQDELLDELLEEQDANQEVGEGESYSPVDSALGTDVENVEGNGSEPSEDE